MTINRNPHLILRPKCSQAIWLLLGCGAFAALSFWMAREKGWIGYASGAFFTLCTLVAAVQLLPGSTSLELMDDGLSFSNMFRVTTIPWSVIDQFLVVRLKQTGLTVRKMVGFNFTPSYDRARLGRRVSSEFAKCEGALPDTYGQSAEALADLLNRYLAEFKEKRGEMETAM